MILASHVSSVCSTIDNVTLAGHVGSVCSTIDNVTLAGRVCPQFVQP